MIYLVSGLLAIGFGVLVAARASRPSASALIVVAIVGLGGVFNGLLELITGRGWTSVSPRVRIALIVFVLLGLPILAMIGLRLYYGLGIGH